MRPRWSLKSAYGTMGPAAWSLFWFWAAVALALLASDVGRLWVSGWHSIRPEGWPLASWLGAVGLGWLLGAATIVFMGSHTTGTARAEASGQDPEPPAGSPVPKEEKKAIPRMKWRLNGASVRGVSHDRSGLPNQDQVGWWPESREGLPVVLAVADGHGSAIRADDGARLAVETAIQVFREYLAELPQPLDHTSCKRAAEDRLPMILERHWKRAVQCHLDEKPLTVNEARGVEEKEGERARKKLEDDPLRAYGTTLVSVLVTESFVICAQIGDGELLVVSESGDVLRPIPENPLHFANETTSLCMPDAWKQVQIHYQTITDSPPTTFLLSTDGYKNAHASEEAFRRTAREFAVALQNQDPTTVFADLPATLAYASKMGSGDDVTVGLLWRVDAKKLLPLEAPTIEGVAAADAIQGQTDGRPAADAASEPRTAEASITNIPAKPEEQQS